MIYTCGLFYYHFLVTKLKATAEAVVSGGGTLI